ncbi:hypothetical protein [Streptomyces sp. NPDC001340]
MALAVERACEPLLLRVRQAGVVSQPLLPAAERRQVVRAIGRLVATLNQVVEEGIAADLHRWNRTLLAAPHQAGKSRAQCAENTTPLSRISSVVAPVSSG